MNVRHLLTALLSALSLPTFATSGFTPGSGEGGGTTHAMPGSKTRAQVVQELADWRRNPVTSDGWKEVGGEVGWVYVGPGQTVPDLQGTAGSDRIRPEAQDSTGTGAGLARSGHLASPGHRAHR